MSEAKEDVQIMSEGLCYLTACAPAGIAGHDVERAVRRQRVAGTSRGWLLADDSTFAGGHTNPCQCDQDPTRKHWLLAC